MKEILEQLQKEFREDLDSAANLSSLEALENTYFSRKSGKVTDLMKQLAALSVEERKSMGELANGVKKDLEAALGRKRTLLLQTQFDQLDLTEAIDVTQPLFPPPQRGHIHTMSQALFDVEEVSRLMGFMVEDGPEIESDYYNFTALNIPPTHPARDMQDTLYIKEHPQWCMRTHVSNMQVRLLRKYGAPLRIAYPGRSFRNEATDARHEHTFYQYECLAVDRDITMGDMIGVSREILKGFFKQDTEIRLRPKYYPFVEPGVNGEVTCTLCQGRGCRVCKGTGWLEVFGAGMMHANVLLAAGINPSKYQGFAFAFGLTRLVMLKYGIEDVRLLQSGDVRFLEQF